MDWGLRYRAILILIFSYIWLIWSFSLTKVSFICSFVLVIFLLTEKSKNVLLCGIILMATWVFSTVGSCWFTTRTAATWTNRITGKSKGCHPLYSNRWKWDVLLLGFRDKCYHQRNCQTWGNWGSSPSSGGKWDLHSLNHPPHRWLSGT